jgi:hypothetical protein
LIDRPIRPLFPEGFFNEVHVVVHTLSLNPEVDADIAALIAVPALPCPSAAFRSPARSVRPASATSMASTCSNPGQTARKGSVMDLVVAGTEAAVLMVEAIVTKFGFRGGGGAAAAAAAGFLHTSLVYILLPKTPKPLLYYRNEKLINQINGLNFNILHEFLLFKIRYRLQTCHDWSRLGRKNHYSLQNETRLKIIKCNDCSDNWVQFGRI